MAILDLTRFGGIDLLRTHHQGIVWHCVLECPSGFPNCYTSENEANCFTCITAVELESEEGQ